MCGVSQTFLHSGISRMPNAPIIIAIDGEQGVGKTTIWEQKDIIPTCHTIGSKKYTIVPHYLVGLSTNWKNLKLADGTMANLLDPEQASSLAREIGILSDLVQTTRNLLSDIHQANDDEGDNVYHVIVTERSVESLSKIYVPMDRDTGHLTEVDYTVIKNVCNLLVSKDVMPYCTIWMKAPLQLALDKVAARARDDKLRNDFVTTTWRAHKDHMKSMNNVVNFDRALYEEHPETMKSDLKQTVEQCIRHFIMGLKPPSRLMDTFFPFR